MAASSPCGLGVAADAEPDHPLIRETASDAVTLAVAIARGMQKGEYLDGVDVAAWLARRVGEDSWSEPDA